MHSCRAVTASLGGTSAAGLIRVGTVQDRPTAVELLATLAEFLEQDILPTVPGSLRYKTLVAKNLLGVLTRELEAGDGPLRHECASLGELVGGATVADTDEERQALVAGHNAELQRRLLGDPLPARPFLLAARDALEAAVRDKLTVNKPGYDAYDMAVEVR